MWAICSSYYDDAKILTLKEKILQTTTFQRCWEAEVEFCHQFVTKKKTVLLCLLLENIVGFMNNNNKEE